MLTALLALAGNVVYVGVALVLFAIVFPWTPPHFWALALLLREHCAAARLPMLPVTAGVLATVRRIVA